MPPPPATNSRVPGSVGVERKHEIERAPRRSTRASSWTRMPSAAASRALSATGAAVARGARRAWRAWHRRWRRTCLDSKRRLLLHAAAERLLVKPTRARNTAQVELRHAPQALQGRHSRRRTRDTLPSRHQGDAQGDAAGRRQAGHPVRRRGGRAGRHRRHPGHHRPQQERDLATTSTRSPNSR